MPKLSLRKISISDKKYFAKWWRDKELLKSTSGILKKITDKELDKYFSRILKSDGDYNFIVTIDRKVIGHIALARRKNGWYETEIVIGEKNWQRKGHGTKAIKLLIKKTKQFGINKVYLEVRPSNERAMRVYEKCGFQRVGIKKYPKNKYLSQTLKMILRQR